VSQHRLIKSPEERKQRIARRASRSDSARLSPAKIHSPVLQLQRTLGNQRVAQLIQDKRLAPQAFQSVRLSRGNAAVGLQRQPGRGIGRQEKEQCIRKWEKNPQEMSILAAEHFAGTETDFSMSFRFANVECINDHDCKVIVKEGGPVFDVRWNKELRRIGVGFNHANGRRFCAYDYDGCDQFNRHTPKGVLTLTLVACHGPTP
jgi:hypothetical protein